MKEEPVEDSIPQIVQLSQQCRPHVTELDLNLAERDLLISNAACEEMLHVYMRNKYDALYHAR